jgi:hypothetical protein
MAVVAVPKARSRQRAALREEAVRWEEIAHDIAARERREAYR